jgi:uncharacterized repeat protein (TIGR01451 family)
MLRSRRLAVLAGLAGTIVWSAAPLVAAPGTPGVPQAPVVIFTEPFESSTSPAVAQLLDSYTGAPPASMTYTANPSWISGPACNGLVASFNSTPGTTGCSASVYNTYIRTIAQALGVQFGGGNDNHVLSDVTVSGFPAPATPAATIQTVSRVPLSSPNRFIAFAIHVGVTTCNAAHPLLRFFLLDGTSEISVNTAAIDPCTAPGGTTVPGGAGGIRIGSFSTDGSILVTGGSVGVKLTNDQTSGSGNDYAIDDIQLLDATPQLDKAFVDHEVPIGGTTDLVFTITNTSELAAKPGWSFTDSLPAGLQVASPATTSTTCTNGVVTAAAGGDSIQAAGDLLTGESSCTVTVRVTSSTSGAYTNGPGNITSVVGLDLPGSDTVTFFSAGLSLDKSGTGPDPLLAGSTITYTFLVTNTGDVTLTNVGVSDPLPGLSTVTCPGTVLTAGASMTCSATYTVTVGDVIAGFLQNTATATGQPPAGPAVTAQDSATLPPSQIRAITLDKTVTVPASPAAGQTITYDFLVTNTGNVPLTNITITDPLSGLSAIACPQTSLAPSANMTCTATYDLTQADLNAGTLSNTATVSGDPPSGLAVTATDGATATLSAPVPVPALPAPLVGVLALLLAAGTAWQLRRSRRPAR